MDAHTSALLLTFVFVLFLLKLGSKFRSSKSGVRHPPGPWKLPIIGNIHQLAGGLPHHTITALAKKHGPVMHLQIGEIPTVVVSAPETAREVLKTHDLKFSFRAPIESFKLSSYNCTNIAFSPCGDYWRHMRKIGTTELFSNRRVQSFKPLRDEETNKLMKWIAGNAGSAPINLTEKTNATFYGMTAKVVSGKECSQQEAFISTAKESNRLAVVFNVADLFPSFKILHFITGFLTELKRVHLELDKILGSIIEEHQREWVRNADHFSRDLVDVLLERHQDNTSEFSPSIDNIKAVVLEIFIAGSETSATTIDWAMTEMLRNPETMKRAQEEVRKVVKERGYVDEDDFNKLAYMKSVIKETLRLHPPAPLSLPRSSGEACEISGYQIPAKTSVVVNFWAINRDARHWGDDAEIFKPERFLGSPVEYKGTHFEFIPFGAGRRICPGMNLGTTNVELTLAKFLYHFDWVLPAGVKPEELDFTEAPGFTFHRKEMLHVVPIVRNPPAMA